MKTQDFINHLKQKRMPKNYEITSFHIKILFNNFPSDKTIDIILRKIFDEGKMETNIPRKAIQE